MPVERLREPMEADPAARSNAVENLAAQLLGETTPNRMTLERYLRVELPMSNERSLGFATRIMVEVIIFRGTNRCCSSWPNCRLEL